MMSDLKRVSQVLESRAERSPQPGLPGIQKRESTGSSRAVSFSLGPPSSRRGTQTSLRSRLRSYDESRVNLDLSTRITAGGVRKYSQEPVRASAAKGAGGGAAKKYSVPASYRRYTAPSQPKTRLPSTSIGLLQRYGHYDLSDYVGMLRYLRINSAKRRKFLKKHRLPSATEFYPEGEAPPEESGESEEEEEEERGEVLQVEDVKVKKPQVKKRNRQKPLARFRRITRTVVMLSKAVTTESEEDEKQKKPNMKSFAEFQYEIESMMNKSGPAFDPSYYKARKEVFVSDEAKAILRLAPEDRTEEQIQLALKSVRSAVDVFSEFPIKMQESLIRVGWYECFDPKRVIIRQGHIAENFYFILSGTAVVTVISRDEDTGEPSLKTVAFLKKGNSFGELALMHQSKRNASVICKDTVSLLAVGREDFVSIFMHGTGKPDGQEPEHVRFLRKVPELQGWPVDKLPQHNPDVCLYTFFRRGLVICKDSSMTDKIYVVVTGRCRVLKSLRPTTPQFSSRRRRNVPTDFSGPSLSPRSVASSASDDSEETAPVSSPSRSSDPLRAYTYPGPAKRRQARSATRPRTDSPGLPPIYMKTPMTGLPEDASSHKQQLEELFNERLTISQAKRRSVLPASERTTPDLSHQDDTISDSSGDSEVFIQVQTLKEGDVFGLVNVVFSPAEGGTGMSLVSDGAECILISRKFFEKHLDLDIRRKIRSTIQPYPSERSLQQKLQDKVNWEEFKTRTVQDLVASKELVSFMQNPVHS
ncbi:uncharacterized protein LOC144876850 isoform X1 [Branchiostoma floridae x Branchiostoma japonicum]